MAEFEFGTSRSPRYPRYALPASIAYARRFYEGAHRSLVDTLTAYKVMGFTGKTGASATALGSVRQYGLIEAPKGGVRISQLGLQLLEPSNEEERVEALLVAANQPTVFAQLNAHFSGEFPRSDEPIRAHLIRHLDFSRKGADECISSLRETLAFVDQHRLSNTEIKHESTEQRTEPATVPVEDKLVQPSLETGWREVGQFPLTRDCAAQIRFNGEVTSAAIDRLVRHIELMREIWTEQ